jgi:hypothetical protein
MPASTRSRLIERSNSAKTPITWNMALPDGVDESSLLLMQIEIDVLGILHFYESSVDPRALAKASVEFLALTASLRADAAVASCA